MYHLIQSKKNVIIILLHNFQTQLHLFKRFFLQQMHCLVLNYHNKLMAAFIKIF